jgi:hypothetical protein
MVFFSATTAYLSRFPSHLHHRHAGFTGDEAKSQDVGCHEQVFSRDFSRLHTLINFVTNMD